jgi:hypothetical protein
LLKAGVLRRLYEEEKIKPHIQDGNQEYIMLLACCWISGYCEVTDTGTVGGAEG